MSAPTGTPRWQNAGRYLSDEAIVVFPESWRDSLWWHESQVENLAGILDEVKQTYNIDENRVYMLGISDGGSGIYYQASRSATPWAGFLPFIAHPAVVANPRTGVDGQLYARNIASTPFFIVNLKGGRLYPADRVEPFIQVFEAAGMDVVFRVRPESGHHMRWWPAEKGAIDDFLRRTRRTPFPDRLSWETDRTDRFNRAHWVLIDELGDADAESDLDPLNTVRLAVSPVLPSGLVRRMFPHEAPSGRIEVAREGNTVAVRTDGVRRYRLLLSPEQFDVSKPVRIETNGARSFEGPVEVDVETLFEWASRDNDRTMLYAAEVDIQVGRH